MSKTLRVAAAIALSLLVYAACSGPSGAPELALSARPRTIDNRGQTATISVTATDAQGKPGTGTVRLTSAAGSLKAGTEVTLLAGAVDADFSCDAAQDPACAGAIRVTGEWVSNGVLAEATTSVAVTVPDAGPPDAGPPDAGPFDAGVPFDAGITGDAGLTLTTADPRIFMSVGDFTDVTATMQINGVPTAGATIDFATTLGVLGPTDGGPGSATYSEVTNASGVAVARFAENGVAGDAVITATHAATGVRADAGVEIVAVNAITHVSTTCGGTACNIMGLRGSGFNENAIMRFALRDAQNRPVPGVRVTFALINAPLGTTIAPAAVSDAQGNADVNVQSGLNIGTFSVRATVIAGVLETTSPTIGVRGAKPSNLGFTLQCARVNLAAYLSPTPPLPISNSCTVTLVDRYGNPVGTGTAVRLNSEAGRVPNQVTTNAFSPTGTNTDEGKGIFAFDTTGPFPAEDVPPLAAAGAQFPYARNAEYNWADAALTRNPRDGLVTIIAYVQGEEHFYDDNSNGVRDTGERFIDQGEPFVDKNDNNVWDPGELNVDPDGDGVWDGPNSTWDSNTTVWTKLFLLYTDYSYAPAVVGAGSTPFVPNGFNVAKGTSVTLDVYLPDRNLNHIESGAGTAIRHTAAKGSVTLVSLNTGLDDYGFQVEAMKLVNATGTGNCAPSQPRCVFLTLFGTWGLGYIGQVRIDGAPVTDTNPPQADVVTVDTSVRSVVSGASVGGTIQ